MAKDPAFLFYPGDYLRDTQCLSEKAQVAYDRIMCEHMRNISEDMNNIIITKERVNFFIKRLSEDEKLELFHVMTKKTGGYQIDWVAESICKRKSYSTSRANNRLGKSKEHMNIISEHMEDENEIINTSVLKVIKTKISGLGDLEISVFTGCEPWQLKELSSMVTKGHKEFEQIAMTKPLLNSADNFKLVLQAFINMIQSTGEYQEANALKRHFGNWITKKNGSLELFIQECKSVLGKKEKKMVI